MFTAAELVETEASTLKVHGLIWCRFLCQSEWHKHCGNISTICRLGPLFCAQLWYLINFAKITPSPNSPRYHVVKCMRLWPSCTSAQNDLNVELRTPLCYKLRTKLFTLNQIHTVDNLTTNKYRPITGQNHARCPTRKFHEVLLC